MNKIIEDIKNIPAISTLTNIKKNRVLKSEMIFTIVAKIGDLIKFMFYLFKLSIYCFDVFLICFLSIFPFGIKQKWGTIKGVNNIIFNWYEKQPGCSLIFRIELHPLSNDNFIFFLFNIKRVNCE